MMNTFFDGSAGNMMAALLDLKNTDLSEEELERLSEMIESARSEGR